MTDDDSKRIILSRRARFVAAALASAGLAVNPACGGETDDGTGSGGAGGSGGEARDASRDRSDEPQVCLSVGGGFGSGGSSGAVGAGGTSDAPMPCLSPPFDAQAEPQPCLSPEPPDAGAEAEPQPCLVPPK